MSSLYFNNSIYHNEMEVLNSRFYNNPQPPIIKNINMYNMNLNDTILSNDENWYITRVPGGWIYRYSGTDGMVFISFNEEFNNIL